MFLMWSTEKPVPSVSWGMACLLACLQIPSILSDWEQDQKDIMLYLPILIAKIV